MSDVTIKPLGDRVLIKPHPKRTESASGLAIVEDYQPDTSGVVVALGDGIEARIQVVHRFADRVLALLEDSDRVSDVEARDIIARMRDTYEPAHVCAVGDEVTFGINAGTELQIAGELYLLVREDDLETLAEPVGDPV